MQNTLPPDHLVNPSALCSTTPLVINVSLEYQCKTPQKCWSKCRTISDSGESLVHLSHLLSWTPPGEADIWELLEGARVIFSSWVKDAGVAESNITLWTEYDIGCIPVTSLLRISSAAAWCGQNLINMISRKTPLLNHLPETLVNNALSILPTWLC